MKCKMQFWNEWDAIRAQNELLCKSVRMGSALVVDHPSNNLSEAIRILALYDGHMADLTEYDLSTLSSAG